MHYRDALQVVQGLALMRFPWDTLTPDTRHTLSIAVYNQASRWEQTGPLSAMEVATLLYSLQQMGTTWTSLDPPLRAALLLGVVASGDVDRLASLEKTKPAALRDNEKLKYGTINARGTATAAPLNDRQNSEWQNSDKKLSEKPMYHSPSPGFRNMNMGEGGKEKQENDGDYDGDKQSSRVSWSPPESEPMSESGSGPGPGPESASALSSGLGFDYVGSEVGVSRTRHELARATAGIVHGLAGLQVGPDPLLAFPFLYLSLPYLA